jgi:uncharacterized membrane protein YjdF
MEAWFWFQISQYEFFCELYGTETIFLDSFLFSPIRIIQPTLVLILTLILLFSKDKKAASRNIWTTAMLFRIFKVIERKSTSKFRLQKFNFLYSTTKFCACVMKVVGPM